MKVMKQIFISVALLRYYIFCQEPEAPLVSKECRERDRLIGSDKEDLYAVVDALQGQTLLLRCRFCNAQPSESPKNWYKIDQIGISKPTEIMADMDNEVDRNRIFINQKHSLIVKNISVEDAGLYSCVHYEDKSNKEKFNFLVDIVTKEKASALEKGNVTAWANYQKDYFSSINSMFRESSGTEFLYVRDILKISMELVTQWGSWSTCQICGRPQGMGLMKRTGKCRLKLNSKKERTENHSADELYLYNAPAISCRALRLQRMFPQISNLTSVIPDFIQEDKCDGICNPDAEGLNKGWKVGKGTGFKYRKHSVLQENSHLTFVCPESTLDNKVVWKKNGLTLKRGDNSNPHVIVDTFNSLYLVDVIPEVAGNYSCYVDNIRMQQIVIFVYSKSKFLTNELARSAVSRHVQFFDRNADEMNRKYNWENSNSRN
ncbi:hypothetical protein GWI33_003443 [Rhynchophorus ferrugineus]|uniref:Ig-like domain-containing protein n=1 Tax=Rhynchophorus ferrugineus TaxID=354439 RepID=A0A834J2X8_RHYFE|nr:hypothetical protein GWI33_003443 [Rhynchophorus ferrugineus]